MTLKGTIFDISVNANPSNFRTNMAQNFGRYRTYGTCPSVVTSERRAGNEVGCSNYDTGHTCFAVTSAI